MRRRHRHAGTDPNVPDAALASGYQASDVRCGIRSFTRDGLQQLRLGSTGMEFASEMLIEAARAGLDVVEVPVGFTRAGAAARASGRGERLACGTPAPGAQPHGALPGARCHTWLWDSPWSLCSSPGRCGSAGSISTSTSCSSGAPRLFWACNSCWESVSQTYALVHRLFDRWIALSPHAGAGIGLGGLLFRVGVAVNVWILASWLAAGQGVYSRCDRQYSLTLMVLGAEIIFASFFLSLLRGSGSQP